MTLTFSKLSKMMFGLFALGICGCASVNSVSLTPIPANRARPVEASTKKWIILGFNFDNDFIDPMVEDLKRQCPGGVVSGILTKDETYSYFLVFRKQVTATGYCNMRTAQDATKRQAPARRQMGSIDE